MWKCPMCSVEVEDSLNACQACGAAIPLVQSSLPPVLDFNRLADTEDAPPHPAIDFNQVAPNHAPALAIAEPPRATALQRMGRGAIEGVIGGALAGSFFAFTVWFAIAWMTGADPKTWVVDFPQFALPWVLIGAALGIPYMALVRLVVRGKPRSRFDAPAAPTLVPETKNQTPV